MAISKVVFGGDVLLDLTSDTLTADKALKGYTFHGADGEPKVGSCEYDVDSSDATSAVAEVLKGKTFAAKGKMYTGTMPNNGAVSGAIKSKDEIYKVPQGYHDGSGEVKIDGTEREKLIPANIRNGVTVLGVTGTMSSSEGVKPQAKTATPKKTEQVILPDNGYTHLSQVTVNPIPYTESTNAAGGKTVNIG